MAKLSTKSRKALPASKFAGPNRSYPVPDKAHAANANRNNVGDGPALTALADTVDAEVAKLQAGEASAAPPAA